MAMSVKEHYATRTTKQKAFIGYLIEIETKINALSLNSLTTIQKYQKREIKDDVIWYINVNE